MTNTTDNSFEIVVNIAEKQKRLNIIPQETTDGAPYYICRENEQHLSEIRKESNGNWVQLWGDLEEQSIQAIGQAIDEKSM